jgi:hypothetical protein
VAAEHGVLRAALDELGWNPRVLANEVNRWLVAHGHPERRVHATAPYPWVRQESVPRPPLPQAVAVLVSEALGRVVTPAQLWPGRGLNDEVVVGAADLHGIGTVENAVATLHELAGAGGKVRRIVAASPATDVVAAVCTMTAAVAPAAASGSSHQYRTPLGEVLAAHVGRLVRLNGQYGGGRIVRRYVAAELGTVIAVIRSGARQPALRRDALVVAADLARLAGWAEFDADRRGLCQRYLLASLCLHVALRLPTQTADTVGMLAYIAAVDGNGPEAVTMANHALREGRHGDPRVRARLHMRAATAAAATGDEAAFRRAVLQAQELLTTQPPTEPPTAGPCGFDDDQAEAEMGHGLLLLARKAVKGRQRLYREAAQVLTSVCDQAVHTDQPPSAMLHAAYLAHAHLGLRDLPGAVAATRTMLHCLDRVPSLRCQRELLGLRAALARHARAVQVTGLLPELDAAVRDIDTTPSRRRSSHRMTRAQTAATASTGIRAVAPIVGGGRC